jgi:Trypsin-like peptidase domain
LVPLGSVSGVRAGQEVVAIGSPLGVLQNSVTRGIVSSIRRLGEVTLLQTDAAINPGNSGGPLLDHHGDVIGITTMSVKATQGLSFAVAADHARQLIDGQRSIPATNATPLSSLNTTLQSSAGSGSDEIRQKGASAYLQTLAQLGGRADGLDEYWRRFKASCYEGTIAGGFEREWFAVWDPKAMEGAVAPGCRSSFAEVTRDAEQIRNEVLAAEEAARQAGVYPGLRRDARRKYRLDGIDR